MGSNRRLSRQKKQSCSGGILLTELRQERARMIVVLFRSKLTLAAGQDYAAANAEMEQYVKTVFSVVLSSFYLVK